MKALRFLGGLALFAACNAPGADPTTDMLPDAGPETPDAAETPDSAPPAPQTVKVRLSVRGSMIAGVPVVFHDAQGNPVEMTITSADGVAEAEVGPGAMATVVDLRGQVPSLTTFVGVEPGDDLVVAAPEVPVAAGMNATVTYTTVPGVFEYLVSAGCATQSVSFLAGLPASDKRDLVIPPDCLIEGGARFHVFALGVGTSGLVSARAVVGAQGFPLIDISGTAWETTATSLPVQVAGASPSARVRVQAEMLPADGAGALYDSVDGNADGVGATTMSVRPGLGGFAHRVTALTTTPEPPPVIGPATRSAIVLPGFTKLIAVETTLGTPLTQLAVDFSGVKAHVDTLAVEGGPEFSTTSINVVTAGEVTQMTGLRTTLLARRADDVVYRWHFVHQPGMSLRLPKLPDGLAAQRPVTFIPSAIHLERGTSYTDYRGYRNAYGREARSAVVWRASLTFRSPTPPPLP
jgi:hypothetical protein